MALDRNGTWWRGENGADLAEYVRLLTQDTYPADEVREPRCGQCGGNRFRLRAELDEGAAVRVCSNCGDQAFIADSEENWDGQGGQECRCPCGADTFDLAVGFALRPSGDVRWITVGERCISCGVLGAFVDWKVDYGPSDHLVEAP